VDSLKELGGAGSDVDVPEGNRVKRSWVNGNGHVFRLADYALARKSCLALSN